MASNAGRISLGLAALAAAVVLFVVLQGNGDGGDGSGDAGQEKDSRVLESRDARRNPGDESKNERPKTAAVPTIVIRNGEPVGGVRELEFEAGDRIRFRVRSDVADEVHVHGYDLSKDVSAGGTVAFDFPATIEGVFEAELEHRGAHILELRVNP